MNWDEEIKSRLEDEQWENKIGKLVIKKKQKKSFTIFSVVVLILFIINFFSIQFYSNHQQQKFSNSMKEYWTSHYYDLEELISEEDTMY